MKKARTGVCSAILIALIAFSALLSLASCNQTIGLGNKVDMSGPVVKITGPDYMANVKPPFTLSGTVVDDASVANVSVTISGCPDEWKCVGGAWSHRAASNASWESVTGATWTEVGPASYEWTVPISVSNPQIGEFSIKVTSTDNFNNYDSSSVNERTVVCDTTDPVCTVTAPLLPVKTSVEAAAMFAAYGLRDLAVLDSLVNGPIEISGSQVENSSLDRLEIEIADADSKVYWSTIISASDSNKPNLRNWSVHVPALTDPDTKMPLSGKKILQIVTKSYDKANNDEVKSNGFFCYWPEADVPWIVSPASISDPSSHTIFPGRLVQGQAYDDDGLSSIEVKLYKGEMSTAEQYGVAVPIDLSVEKPGYSPWSIPSPTESGIYTVVVNCIDVNGIPAQTSMGSFTVEDIDVPIISVSSPDLTTSLFGNEFGMIDIAGLVDDNAGVKDLRLVWIDPHALDAGNNQLLYLDKDYDSWKDGSFVNEFKTDSSGNKVWILTMGTETTNENGRKIRNFSKKLSLFSDLGISGTKTLTNQVFILRAEDGSGKVRIQKLTLPGDSRPPVLTITKAVVTHLNGTSISYSIDQNQKLPAFASGDKVSILGTWKDDSTDVWADKTKKGKLIVSWGTGELTAVAANDGLWSTTPVAPPAGAVASITASMPDFGGNVGDATATFYVETDSPTLVRVSSDNPDGSYTAGTVEAPIYIDLYLDFNKKVTFDGGTSAPTLSLSNGAFATYLSGNGSARHVFRYTIAKTDTNVPDLDATGINPGGHTWHDSVPTAADTSSIPIGSSNVNAFAGNKGIAIDTKAPTIHLISSITPAGSYKVDDEINIAVEFSEPISIKNGTPLLKLSSGANAFTSGSVSQMSAIKYVFTYKVKSPETDSDGLTVNSFLLNSSVIQDVAGNDLDLTIPNSGSIGTTLIIDTTAPNAPAITGVATGTTYYEAKQVTITGEANSSLQYSINNGSTWTTVSSHTTTLPLATNGIYNILAHQIDKAGNKSPAKACPSVKVDIGTILERISSDDDDGVYTTGDSITVKMYFRLPVYYSVPPKIKLNSTATATEISCTGGSGTKVLSFMYTIHDGDNEPTALDVTGFTGTLTDKSTGGSTFPAFTLPGTDQTTCLSRQKSFQVQTGIPSALGITVSGTTVTIRFNKPVYRGTGSLVITQDPATVRVPAVMSVSDYEKNSSWCKDYYEEGLNGASSAGVPDLGTKYILKYKYDGSTSDVTNAYKGSNAHIRTVSANSSIITVDSSSNSIKLNLSGSSKLPVMGASYSLTMPEGFVQDAQGNKNPAYSKIFTSAGVEPPVIRVKKDNESFAIRKNASNVYDDTLSVVAQQQSLSEFKVDCATPGATLGFEVNYKKSEPITIGKYSDGVPPKDPAAIVSCPDTTGLTASNFTNYGAPVVLGSDAGITTRCGVKYAISAISTKTDDNNITVSAPAYEMAYRSVLVFNNDGGVPLRDYDGARSEAVWVRGGGSPAGETLISAFPLSWNDTERKGLIHLMTRDTENTNIWYWSTWRLSTTAYVGVLCGSVPLGNDMVTVDGVSVNDSINGPEKWGWGKNSWVSAKDRYPVYPGESRELLTKPTTENGFEYYNTLGTQVGPFEFASSATGSR